MTVRLTVIIPIISNNAIHLVISEYSYQLNNESSIILALFLFARHYKSLICSRSVGPYMYMMASSVQKNNHFVAYPNTVLNVKSYIIFQTENRKTSNIILIVYC